MKKFVNDPKKFVPEMLKGIALANPGTLKYVPEFNLIMRADAPRADKVSIIQGSGSGHEPAHVMIVGKGMLDGACPGDVFAAPPMDYVVGASKLLNSPKGILHIVNNYSGDRMAFEMATEMLDAEGITVKTLFVDDDVSVQNSTYTVGRRGVAGNFFVIKALGAASENGASLDELMALGERVNNATKSMGMALSGCTPPAKGTPIFTLADNEMEMGVGIHGEPGRARKPFATAQSSTRRWRPEPLVWLRIGYLAMSRSGMQSSAGPKPGAATHSSCTAFSGTIVKSAVCGGSSPITRSSSLATSLS